MPLASLSTLAVIKPGPTTAKNSMNRAFQLFRNFMGTVRRHRALRLRRCNRINGVQDSEQEKLENNSIQAKSSAKQLVPARPQKLVSSRSVAVHDLLRYCKEAMRHVVCVGVPTGEVTSIRDAAQHATCRPRIVNRDVLMLRRSSRPSVAIAHSIIVAADNLVEVVDPVNVCHDRSGVIDIRVDPIYRS